MHHVDSDSRVNYFHNESYFFDLLTLGFWDRCFAQENFPSIDSLESFRKRDSTFLAGPRPLYIVDSLVTDYQALNQIDRKFIKKLEFVEPIDVKCKIYGDQARYGIVFITLGEKKKNINFSAIRKKQYIR